MSVEERLKTSGEGMKDELREKTVRIRQELKMKDDGLRVKMKNKNPKTMIFITRTSN